MTMRFVPTALLALVVLSACSDEPASASSSDTTAPQAATSTLPDPAAPSTAPPDEPVPAVDPAFPIEFLHGADLEQPSELLIVAGDHLIDLDAGSVERLDGLPEPPDESNRYWTVPAGSHAVIHCGAGCPEADVFALAKGESVARPIGKGFPTPGINGVWIRKVISRDACTLEKVGWTGEILRPATDFSCGLNLLEETPLGLAVWSDAPRRGLIFDPTSLAIVWEVGELAGVVGSKILYRQDDGFVLLDTESGSEFVIALPTDVGGLEYGKPNPDKTFLAVGFKHPAWPGPRQRLDIWLLDMRNLEWRRLPSMPVAAALKASDYAWTADGRLVLYGNFDHAGIAVAAYRPGDAQLQVAKVDYRPAGSIAAWCTSAECAT